MTIRFWKTLEHLVYEILTLLLNYKYYAGVQGTCKYGTRVDYILSSSDSTYKFVPGSYLVLSSKGTSDHHIVKVDVVKVNSNPTSTQENLTKQQRQPRQKVARITHSSPSTCIWKTHTGEID